MCRLEAMARRGKALSTSRYKKELCFQRFSSFYLFALAFVYFTAVECCSIDDQSGESIFMLVENYPFV